MKEFDVYIKSCSDYHRRGVHYKNIAAVVLYELVVVAQARSEREILPRWSCSTVALFYVDFQEYS